MLIFSRKVDEVICIGPDIEICIVDVRQGRVRIGIKAPRNISVDRAEVRDEKESQKPQTPKKL